jgi:hypothetical protein
MNAPATPLPAIVIPVNAWLVTLRSAGRDVPPVWDQSTVNAVFGEAERIWQQAGIRLELRLVSAIREELPRHLVEPIDDRGIAFLVSRITPWKREAFNVAFLARTASSTRQGGHVQGTRFVVMPHLAGTPTSSSGRTLAHEFGHILLGPEHFVPDTGPRAGVADNLMMQGYRGTRLTPEQIERARQFRVY